MSPRPGRTGRPILLACLAALALLGAIFIAKAYFLPRRSSAPLAAAAAPALSPSQITVGGFTLTSDSVTLPDAHAQFPAGSNADVMNANCTACHSASMVLTQPRLSADQWKATVEKMRESYKAPISESDVPAIVDYLTAMSAKLRPGSPGDRANAAGAPG